MKKILFYIIILLILFSCNDFALKEKIIDNYYIIAGDELESAFLSYYLPSDSSNYSSIINATVFAVGFNNNFMIIKQHPRSFPKPPDKTVTNYFILPLKNGMEWRNKNNLIGPLTLNQFNQKRKELEIPDNVVFTIEIKKLK